MEEIWQPSYRESPFIVGIKYRVINRFNGIIKNNSIKPGCVLEYIQSGYSRYDRMSIYQFKNIDGKKICWGLHDDQDFSIWNLYFEIVNNT